MKPNHGHGAMRTLGGRIAAVLLGVVCAVCVSATPALADGAGITNDRTKVTYTDLATATAEAQSGDTILLGEGNYTLFGVKSEGTTKGKDLTFKGLGTDKTAWNIGALVPDPANFGTEYNGDYSFDGAGTVTFENMTLRSGTATILASFVLTTPLSITVSLTARRSTGATPPLSSTTLRSTPLAKTIPCGPTAPRS